MEIAKLVVQLLQALAWPLIAVFLAIRFRRNIEDLLAGTLTTPSPAALPRSQVSPVAYRVAMVNESTILTDQQVNAAALALQTQVHRDFAPVWGVDAEITFVPKDSKPDADSWWLMVLDDSDVPGPLAYRALTPKGLPLGKVFAKSASGAGFQWTLAAGHVLLEMLANPRTNLTVFVQTTDNTGKLYAYEVCDPCDAESLAYSIDGIRVSDFVFPAWFDSFRKPESTQFDYCNHITAPFTVAGDGGYLTVFDVSAGAGWQPVFATKAPEPTARRRKGDR